MQEPPNKSPQVTFDPPPILITQTDLASWNGANFLSLSSFTTSSSWERLELKYW